MADSLEQEEDAWVLAIPIDELWEGEMLGLCLCGVRVLLVHLPHREIHAYENRCPHAGAPLSEGQLSGDRLRCAAHHWEFDVRSGTGIDLRNCTLRSYPVKIVDGDVMVRVSRAMR